MALSAARSSAAAAPTRARTEASPPAVGRTRSTTSTSSPSAPNRHGAESSLFRLARPPLLHPPQNPRVSPEPFSDRCQPRLPRRAGVDVLGNLLLSELAARRSPSSEGGG